MKQLLLSLALCLCLLLTGCAGDTVIYQVECDHDDQTQVTPPPVVEPDHGRSVKTGLAIVTDRSASENAARAVFTATVAAVTVDDDGRICDAVLDGVYTTVTFDESGTITGDITSALLSRRELAEDYGMGPVTQRQDEWQETAEELTERVEDTAAAELGLLTGYPVEMVAALEKAAANARHLGAAEEDELRLALNADLSDSASATDREAGRVRLACDAAAVTFRDETISACVIDSVQADVPFDAMGTITTDVTGPAPTKTELGDDYGMKAYGGAKYEWYQQAENFARYVTGKTAAQVLAIPVADGKATQADLYTSVTISITPFQELIARAGQERSDT